VIIEVTFKGNRREFFEWPFPEAPATKTAVIVEAERGEDLGHVHAVGDLAIARKRGTTHGKASPDPLRKVVRAANGDEIAKATHLRDEEKNVRTRAIEKVRTLGLDMKVSDTEWQWDKKRLTIYFTAEQRIDFRSLVRQLEGLFGTRVHMWHIGVRDEAKRVDGLGRCGRQLCSASWLPELVPVKSSVAKDQHLSTLNPAQISGACGRLMCCLRYEHEFYVTQRKRFPKEGKIVKTLQGEEKVISLDIFRETVTLRSIAGEARVVPLAQLHAELGGAPVPAVSTGELDVIADEPSMGLTGEYQVPREVVLEDDGEDAEEESAGDEAPIQRAQPPREQPPQRQQQPQRQQHPRPQQQQQNQRPRQQQARPPQPNQGQPQSPDQPQEQGAPQGAEGQGGGKRRRRGRRGGRRGRGGPPGQGGQGGQGSPPAPSGPQGEA
jgi:cell fate regulator YaaT (PSP1 superfamily)